METKIINKLLTPAMLEQVLSAAKEEISFVPKGVIIKFKGGLMLQSGFFGTFRTSGDSPDCKSVNIGSGKTISVCKKRINYFEPFAGHSHVIAVVQEGINLNNDGQALWLQTGELSSDGFSARLIDQTGASADVGIAWLAWGEWK